MKSVFQKLQESHWFQIGVAVAKGESSVTQFPPDNPNAIIGFFSVVAADPDHWIWQDQKNSRWVELGQQIREKKVPDELISQLHDRRNARMASSPEPRGRYLVYRRGFRKTPPETIGMAAIVEKAVHSRMGLVTAAPCAPDPA